MPDPTLGSIETRIQHARTRDQICDRFESELKQGNSPRLEDFLEEVADPFKTQLLKELLELELDYRGRNGKPVSADDYCQRFPNHVPLVRETVAQAARNRDAGADETIDGTELITRFSQLTGDELFQRLEQSGLLDPKNMHQIREQLAGLNDCEEAVESLICEGLLTRYQLTRISQPPIEKLSYGDYVLIDELGSGGMGVVFRARHRRMDRTVALKLISSATLASDEIVTRFSREVRTLAKLKHPNIVMAYDAGEDEGRHFLVMEYIEGCDLRRLVKQRGPLPLVDALEYIKQAAEGLGYAHSQGIVHRDVKPGNLLLDHEGAIKVLDLGLARWEYGTGDATAGAEADSTRSGQFIGTPGFMSPEQIESSQSADARSDIYGLGCTLWYLLTGETLYRSESLVDTLNAHVHELIPSLLDRVPGTRPELDELWQSMVAKSPEDRPATMQSVANRLQAILADLQVDTSSSAVSKVSSPSPMAATDASGFRRGKWWLSLGSAAALLLFAAAIVIILRHRDGSETKISLAEDGLARRVEIDNRSNHSSVTISAKPDGRSNEKQADSPAEQSSTENNQSRSPIALLDLELTESDNERVRIEHESLIINALGFDQHRVETPVRVADFTFRSKINIKRFDPSAWGAVGIQCPTAPGNYYHFVIDPSYSFRFSQGGLDQHGKLIEKGLIQRSLPDVEPGDDLLCEFSIIGTHMTAKVNGKQVAMLELPEEEEVLNQQVRRIRFIANNVDAEFRNPKLTLE